MRSVTIRNLSDEAKLELRKQAAARGISMEQHLRDLVQAATHTQTRQKPFDAASATGVSPSVELTHTTEPGDGSFGCRTTLSGKRVLLIGRKSGSFGKGFFQQFSHNALLVQLQEQIVLFYSVATSFFTSSTSGGGHASCLPVHFGSI